MPGKINLILDATIFASFLVVFDPARTGATIYEQVAYDFTAAIVPHLLFHWVWITVATRDFFSKFLHRSGLNYAINAFLFVFTTAVMFSGPLVSTK